MRSLCPTTHQRLPSTTPASPSTLQSIKELTIPHQEQQWPITSTTHVLTRNVASPYTIINDPHFHHNVSKSITSYMVRYLNRPQEENFIKAYYQLSPFTITPTNIFANYSKECATWWYVERRATARAAEKLAGYISKGLRTALEAVPSITTKIRSFALM